eukprot:5003741-Pleurochrysis_carterae.AAC.2
MGIRSDSESRGNVLPTHARARGERKRAGRVARRGLRWREETAFAPPMSRACGLTRKRARSRASSGTVERPRFARASSPQRSRREARSPPSVCPLCARAAHGAHSLQRERASGAARAAHVERGERS